MPILMTNRLCTDEQPSRTSTEMSFSELTSTTPSSRHCTRTCRAPHRQAEWTTSKCKHPAPTWRNVAQSVETKTDECPSRRLRCRRRPNSRPYSLNLPEKKRVALKRSPESRVRIAQSDFPVFRACRMWNHSAHDNKPRPCASPLEPVNCRTD